MAVSIDALIRYRVIDRCLRDVETDYNWPLLAARCQDEILQETGRNRKPSRRTIMGDIGRMRSGILGYEAPINYAREGNFYFYQDPKFSINNVPLKKAEMGELKSALTILKQFSGKQGANALTKTLRKLEESLNIKETISRDVIKFEENLNESGQQWLDKLYAATKEKRALSIRYEPFGKEVRTVNVSPFLLKEYNNRWFLIALDHKFGKISNLGMDRIREINDSLQDFRDCPSFCPQNHLKNVVGVSVPENAEPQRITFKAYGNQQYYTDKKPLHSSQKCLERNEEFALFEIFVIPNYELESKFLAMGEKVELLAPADLRDRMKVRVEGLGALYT